MNIIIGTRGSQLSQKQTNLVKQQLLLFHPETTIEIKIIMTKGDKNMSPIPLDTIGKGWFTKELDKALLQGEIDIAVHSMKDLPESLPEGLIIAGIPEREDIRDVLVSKNGDTLKTLRTNAVIGTDSIRRKIQILHKRSDVIIRSVRGNINTRLEKLERAEYDALILAAAGLKRLKLDDQIIEYFRADDVVPSPGQGALAVVVKETNKALVELVKSINDKAAVVETTAERAFAKAVGGGCKTPTGAYAICKGDQVTLHGMIGMEDGSFFIRESLEGRIEDAEKIGVTLAQNLLSKTPGEK